ncbi:N-acetylmuramoyl-L-alanine amidase [Bacteroides sp. 224]|uniref:N-acetylmuramoyl-L-alanine amidase family protein n=1 Tax=Bacteroides sp. 224 TaxID=2302936 RepID=UPI0013D2174D|nr:N-acetylmuramoyl-L-alanine amidase [Bacteroides sp. 224]NDV65046.1 N-acetylmuramoyl-L-alanine amidase [Bacteroides sp. 224]
MKLDGHYILYAFIGIWLFISPMAFNTVWAKDFIVVIDAGHGGKDPGAVGKISKEKDINLKVALKLGDRIKKNCQDVKVVYTRDKDVFIPLDRRAQIANEAKADLFISIHTNSVASPKTVKGTSTWTLGLARSDANLAVAKRENSVIMYEGDYQTRYAGFNPDSSESYIIFEFIQDQYMSQSVRLASLVQQHFKGTCKRGDRGVHQAGFLVLKNTAMPGILVELGFISTPEEERYLNTEAGANNLANGIYCAFLNYKEEQQAQSASIISVFDEVKEQPKEQPKELPKEQLKEPLKPSTPVVATNEIIFKVQILTASSVLNKNDKRFKGLKDVDYYKDGKIYKYTYGASADYNEVLKTRRRLAGNFKGAFVVAFKNGKRIDTNKAIEEFKKKRNK